MGGHRALGVHGERRGAETFLVGGDDDETARDGRGSEHCELQGHRSRVEPRPLDSPARGGRTIARNREHEEIDVITSIFPTICADDVAATRDFYVELFDFRVVFDSGWYAQLEALDGAKPQIGIVERDHETVPAAFRRDPAGVLIAIEVDDVDAVHARAEAARLEMPLNLRSETFGQRHFMTIDPSGTLVDVITPIPPTGDFAGSGAGESQS